MKFRCRVGSAVLLLLLGSVAMSGPVQGGVEEAKKQALVEPSQGLGGSVDRIALDGLFGWLLSLGDEDLTNFGSGYSDSAFRRITIGMTEVEVVRLCGRPLLSSRPERDGDIIYWAYAVAKRKGNHHIREVVFRKGRVVRRKSDFWVD